MGWRSTPSWGLRGASFTSRLFRIMMYYSDRLERKPSAPSLSPEHKTTERGVTQHAGTTRARRGNTRTSLAKSRAEGQEDVDRYASRANAHKLLGRMAVVLTLFTCLLACASAYTVNTTVTVDTTALGRRFDGLGGLRSGKKFCRSPTPAIPPPDAKSCISGLSFGVESQLTAWTPSCGLSESVV